MAVALRFACIIFALVLFISATASGGTVTYGDVLTAAKDAAATAAADAQRAERNLMTRTPVRSVDCVPDGAPTESDLDHDGIPALYAPTSTNVTVYRNGDYTTAPGSSNCWLAGDPDDDGTARVPSAPSAPSVPDVYVAELHPYAGQVCKESKDACKFVDRPPYKGYGPGRATLDAGQTGWFGSYEGDPDGDQITTTFDWGDGQTTVTPLHGSGYQVSATHAWDSPGVYCATTQNTDQYGLVGEKSDCDNVTVRGEDQAPYPTSLTYTQSTQLEGAMVFYPVDPEGDRVQADYYNGDGRTYNSGWLYSGSQAYFSTYWPNPGTYCTQIRLTDDRGATTGWSGCYYVTVSGVPSNSPTQPTVSGPTSGSVGAQLTYTATASDPNNDVYYYTFDWGDGSSTQTGYYANGVSGTAQKSYGAAGTYCITVTATDSTGYQSDPSDCYNVQIGGSGGGGNHAPATPAVPSGPSTVASGTLAAFSTSDTDPDGDNVQYTFDWGDGSTSASNQVASGSTQTRSHSWNAAGSYCVKAMATDVHGTPSGFSGCHTVVVSGSQPLAPSAPQGVSATPTAGGQVTVSWSAPSSAGSSAVSSYTVYVLPPQGDWTPAGTASAGARSFVHSVSDAAGTYFYRVTASNAAAGEGPASTEVSANAYHDYRVELKAWIPQAAVTDPVANQPTADSIPGCDHSWSCTSAADNAALNHITCDNGSPPYDRVDGFYGGDTHNDYAGSYRVISDLTFRWDGYSMSQVSVPSDAKVGASHQYRQEWHGSNSWTCLNEVETATGESDASGSGSSFTLHYHSSNPIAQKYAPDSWVPPIDGNVQGDFQSDGSLSLHYTTDDFPSHGIEVVRDGTPQMILITNDASCVDGMNAHTLKDALSNSQSGGTLVPASMPDDPNWPTTTSPYCS